MWTYLVKRLLLMFVTLFGICVISFIVVSLAPGDPAYTAAGISQIGGRGKGNKAATDEVLEHTRAALYLDRPAVLNLSPRKRSSVAQEFVKKICEGSDYVRVETNKKVIGGIGTAGLDIFIGEAAQRAALAAPEVAKLQGEIASLDEVAAVASGDASKLAQVEEKVSALEKRFGERGPRFSKRTSSLERAQGWVAWGKEHATDRLVGVNALLDTLDQLVPKDKGGPAAKGSPEDRARAWTDWWKRNGDAYSPETAEKAVRAYMDAGEADRPARLAELERIGGAATPAVMSVYESSSSERRRLAAFALSLVAHKPWDLTVKPQQRTDLEKEWSEEKKKLDDAHSAGQMQDKVYATSIRDLGEKEAYVQAKIVLDHEQQELNIARWWFRAEEEFVDFGALRQVGRAFTQTQFGKWFRSLAGGLDFGESFVYKGKTVKELILKRLPVTLWLNFFALVFTYLIAIPLGVFSATHPKSLADRVTTVSLFVLYSLPSFWVGAVLILLVTGPPPWFPSHGIDSIDSWKLGPWDRFVDWVRHMVLPVTCLTYGGIAYISRQMRAGMLETIRQDYVRTARAKGLSERVVIFKHALRNSLIPIVTILAFLLPAMFGGSVIIESIFSIDGLGRLMFEAILARDLPLIMAEVFISGLLTLAGVLLADITYAVVDPRIELK